MKNLKLFLIQLVLVMVMLFSIKPVSAATTFNVNIDKTNGSEFLEQILNSKGDSVICIAVNYTNNEEKYTKLKRFEEEVKEASKYHLSYGIYASGVDVFKLSQCSGSSYGTTYIYLDEGTKSIREIETSKYVFDIDKTSGKEFLNKIHSDKGNNKIKLIVNYKNKKEANIKLKRFADKVKKASKYHLAYGIYTKDNIDSFATKNGYAIISETTKDVNACERLISKIPNWNKLSDTDKFLKLSAICNSRSEYEKPGTDFHFYNSKNKLVCWDYAVMYKRILEMITYKGKAEILTNSEANHALVLIRVDNNYFEGNNWFLTKNYKDSRLSFRSWYKQNPKEFGKTKLEKEFIKANGI